MRIAAIMFVLVSFTLLRAMILFDESEPEAFDFPILEVTTFEFIDLSGGCGGFVDCIEYVGAVIFNFTVGIIFLVLFIIDLFVYVIQLLALIITTQFTGIPEAPWYINFLLTSIFLFLTGLIIYKLIRRGSSNA